MAGLKFRVLLDSKDQEKVFRDTGTTVPGGLAPGIVFKTKGTSAVGLEILFLKLDIFVKGMLL